MTTNDTENQQDSTGSDRQHASREAANYRRRLRDTEAERDAANELAQRRLHAMIGAAVQAAGIPAKAWEASAHDTADLLDEDGLPDPAKLADALAATATDFGLNRAPQRMDPNPQQGSSNGGGPPAAKSWGSALKGS